MPAAIASDATLHHALHRTIRFHFAHDRGAEDLCRCVGSLVDLLDARHDQPVRRLEPGVRRIVLEHAPVGSDGRKLEEGVQLILNELDRLRQVQVRRGEWSDAPVPPQMFG